MRKINDIISKSFLEIAEYLETGNTSSKARVLVTGIGCELGEENVFKAAQLANKGSNHVIYIGTMSAENMECVYADCENKAQEIMNKFLLSNKADAAVTMHHSFPIGTTTIGKLQSSATGLAFFLASTTGTASTNRVEAMVKNAIAGKIVARASGIDNPSIGILNVDGARQCESILKKISEKGYNINFAKSNRADGGSIMRGNDVLQASADVIVCDSLTGNIIMKMISAYNTGGNSEVSGWGYGPGVAEDIQSIVLIVSRASGTAVVANAINYAGDMHRAGLCKIAKDEYQKAKSAGLLEELSQLKEKNNNITEEVSKPSKEIVTSEISGIDVLELDDAIKLVWAAGIYAESGMGCTGPLLMVNEKNIEKAKELLKQKNFI